MTPLGVAVAEGAASVVEYFFEVGEMLIVLVLLIVLSMAIRFSSVDEHHITQKP